MLGKLQRLKEESKKGDITDISFPMGKNYMMKVLRQNNTRAHIVCAETNSRRIDHYIVDRNPEMILLFIKNPEGKGHWCAIPSLAALSRLVSSGIAKSKRARFICSNCNINTFRTPTKLKTIKSAALRMCLNYYLSQPQTHLSNLKTLRTL